MVGIAEDCSAILRCARLSNLTDHCIGHRIPRVLEVDDTKALDVGTCETLCLLDMRNELIVLLGYIGINIDDVLT